MSCGRLQPATVTTVPLLFRGLVFEKKRQQERPPLIGLMTDPNMASVNTGHEHSQGVRNFTAMKFFGPDKFLQMLTPVCCDRPANTSPGCHLTNQSVGAYFPSVSGNGIDSIDNI